MSVTVDEYVARVVAEAPPLSDYQRERISALLATGGDTPRRVTPQEPPRQYPQIMYRHLDACGCLVYLGITNAFHSRTKEHSRDSWWSKFSKTVDITDLGTTDAKEAREVERAAITDEHPVFNSVHASHGRESRIVKYLVNHEQWDHLVVGTQSGPGVEAVVRQLLNANADDAINWISGE